MSILSLLALLPTVTRKPDKHRERLARELEEAELEIKFLHAQIGHYQEMIGEVYMTTHRRTSERQAMQAQMYGQSFNQQAAQQQLGMAQLGMQPQGFNPLFQVRCDCSPPGRSALFSGGLFDE